MQVFATVLLIALGTAALAALIVAADWDLMAVRGWHELTAPGPRRLDHDGLGPASSGQAWSREFRLVPRQPDAPAARETGETEGPEPGCGHPGPSRADQWLAAAAAHRLAGYRGDLDPIAVTDLPSRPLREVLADRSRTRQAS